MSKLIRRLTLKIFLGIVLVSCGARSLDQKQLIGKWVVDRESSNIFELSKRNLSPVLVLQADGRFNVVDFPGEMFSPLTQEQLVPVTGSGKWQKQNSDSGAVVDLVFDTGNLSRARLPYGMKLFLESTARTPALTYFRGDPDSNLRLDFVKM